MADFDFKLRFSPAWLERNLGQPISFPVLPLVWVQGPLASNASVLLSSMSVSSAGAFLMFLNAPNLDSDIGNNKTDYHSNGSFCHNSNKPTNSR